MYGTPKKSICCYCGSIFNTPLEAREHFSITHAEERAEFVARRMERFGYV